MIDEAYCITRRWLISQFFLTYCRANGGESLFLGNISIIVSSFFVAKNQNYMKNSVVAMQIPVRIVLFFLTIPCRRRQR